MKENYSLQLSKELHETMQKDLSGLFYDVFPFAEVREMRSSKERDRIYNTENTLLTMILTMTEEDKSLQNSVNIYSHMHDRNMERIQAKQSEISQLNQAKNIKRRVGRPRKTAGRIAKSKVKEISRDTSAYSQARKRLPKELFDLVFLKSRETKGMKYPGTWHNRRVFITDGTYLQMQDTQDIRQEFSKGEDDGYPKGLLEVIIEQGSGLVYDYELSSNKKSELELLSRMIGNIPSGSLLLADDLYNCLVIFLLLQSSGVDIIVPGKRIRNYIVVEKIVAGDEIVDIKVNIKKSRWYQGEKRQEKVIRMRRIEYSNPNNEEEVKVLYTSILDKNIRKEEFILKYESRWDIEISIREIKTIMDINIVRSKSCDTAYKEVTAALIAYNYIRRIIVKFTGNSDFSPETDIIQKYYANHTPVLMDKLGRRYSRWSPGRGGKVKSADIKAHNTI